MSWTAFPDRIPRPGGKSLRTLRDASRFIEKLPEAEVSKPVWQTALRVMLQAADHGGPGDFARLGVVRALQGYRNEVALAALNRPFRTRA